MARLAVLIAGLPLIAASQASDVVDRSIPQGFLSKYMSDTSKSPVRDYDKFITPTFNNVKHGSGPGVLSYHSNPTEHSLAKDDIQYFNANGNPRGITVPSTGASPYTIVDDKPVLHRTAQVQGSMLLSSARAESSISTKDFYPPRIADKEENQVVQELLANDSYKPITLSALGVGLLSLVTVLGVRMRRHLQPATAPASSGGPGPVTFINTASALGDNIMEMKSQDSSANYGAEAIETIPSCKVDSDSYCWGQLSPQKLRPLTVCYAIEARRVASYDPDVLDSGIDCKKDASVIDCNMKPVMPAAACHLELMGLGSDITAFRRLARGVGKMACAKNMLLGLNVPNKKRDEPLLEWTEALHQELPNVDICVHYSLKHQRSQGEDAVEKFVGFCQKAESVGVARILLVTGPRGPRKDTPHVLEKLARSPRRQSALGSVRLGVAFNACLPTEQERVEEQRRLVRKLKTGLVKDVWLNLGSDVRLLEEGISFVRAAAAEFMDSSSDVQILGSVLLPNPAQLKQMRERPWGGVHLGEEYLSSLAGMKRCTQSILKLYGSEGVQPLLESKVRNEEDISSLENLLQSLRHV